MSKSTISWTAALRELKADRFTPSPIREERLRTSSGSWRASALKLSVWRGCSSRRYVVMVESLDSPDLADEHAAVVLAVARDEAGNASIIAVRACERGDAGYLGWLAACAQRGATELHIHRLAETKGERAMVAADLNGSSPRPIERGA